MKKFDNYLNYIRCKYNDFRYFSDKNSLEIIDNLPYIEYKFIENSSWFCLIYINKNISTDICFFGYLEVINNFSNIINIIKKFSLNNKCKKIIWPINLSVWNSYRFSNEKFEKTILWEYENNNSLHELLLNNWFNIYETYLTVFRDWTNPFINYIKDIDISIEVNNSPKDCLLDIYNLSLNIFKNALIVDDYQFNAYMKVYLELYKNNTNIFFIYYKWKKIGFLSSFFEYDYFVIKTFWILSDYRLKWYWNMLLDYVFNFYFQKNIYKSYWIYMKYDSDIMKMSNDWGMLYRKYFTYLLSL